MTANTGPAQIAPWTEPTAGVVSVVALAGGLSDPSSTRSLAERIARAVSDELRAAPRPGQRHDTSPGARPDPDVTRPTAQVHVQVVDARATAVDAARALVEGGRSAALDDALSRVERADVLVVASPVFRESVSGVLKSFLDLVDSRAFARKPVVIAATGGSDRHALMIEQALRPVLVFLGAYVAPTGVFSTPADAHDAARADELTRRIGRAAAEAAELLVARGARGSDGAHAASLHPARVTLDTSGVVVQPSGPPAHDRDRPAPDHGSPGSAGEPVYWPADQP